MTTPPVPTAAAAATAPEPEDGEGGASATATATADATADATAHETGSGSRPGQAEAVGTAKTVEGGGAGEGAETAGAAEEAGTAYEAEPTVAPAARRRLPGLLKVAGLVLAIVAALFVAAYFSRDTPAAAKAGDCAHNAGSEEKPDVSLVDCGSADAEFTVLKVVHGADEKECETEPALVATYVETRRSSVLVLCLGEHG